jgi:hypothetical protein
LGDGSHTIKRKKGRRRCRSRRRPFLSHRNGYVRR